MPNPDTLVPPAAASAAQPHGRLGFAAGPRLFLLLAIGLVWLVPAFVDLRLGYAMLAWDGLVLLAWIADAARLPRPSQIAVTRSWVSPLSLSVPADVRLSVSNGADQDLDVTLLDAVPHHLLETPPTMQVRAAAKGRAEASYTVRPLIRGDVALGATWLRYRGPLGIAERWAWAGVAQTVRVYPNLDDARQQAIYLVRSRQTALERRHASIPGAGREFDRLREYRDGDDVRDICWTAAARRGKLVTRTFQAERSQAIWLVVDSGRLMRTRIGGLSKLDFAVNAALCVAQVALHAGDRVGLLAYGRTVHHRVPAGRGASQLRVLIEQLAGIREETAEANHLQAACRLLADQKRRCLIVWLTDLAETAMTPEVIDAAQMMRRHLVLFTIIGQPDLADAASRDPAGVKDMYEMAAAQEVLHRREMLLARLRDRGVLALEAETGTLSATLVNRYLAIKARNQL